MTHVARLTEVTETAYSLTALAEFQPGYMTHRKSQPGSEPQASVRHVTHEPGTVIAEEDVVLCWYLGHLLAADT